MSKSAPAEYYHIFNRGMQKQVIFNSDDDKFRFLFLILTFQSDVIIKNISRELRESVQHSMLHIKPELRESIIKARTVELNVVTLMPNHFHIIVKELKEGGVAKYMQRVLNSYTKYFNIKYTKSGHLFQNSYKSVYIENDFQLLHTSGYVHKNPKEIMEWKNKLEEYPFWSLNLFWNVLKMDQNIKCLLNQAPQKSGCKIVQHSMLHKS
jgi:putative transposase